jgi:MFS family permease
MRRYIVRTLLYGVLVGILLFFIVNGFFTGPIDIGVHPFFLVFFVLLLFVLFLITEILPRTNSTTPEAKAKRQDKLFLFILLALSGTGLALVLMLSTANWYADSTSEGISSGLVLAVCCGFPFGLIYIPSIFVGLTRLIRRRSESLMQVSGNVTNDHSPTNSPQE